MLRFGTDGVRGRAYEELLPDDVVRLAQAAAEVLSPIGPVVVGRDTRESSAEFAAALAAGFSSVGVSTIDMGVAPTPAVAWAAAQASTPGAMVSASHNPWYDNGVKAIQPRWSKTRRRGPSRLGVDPGRFQRAAQCPHSVLRREPPMARDCCGTISKQ